MLLMPSTLQNSKLPASAKRFVQSIQHRLPDSIIGIDGINLSGNKDDDYFSIISPHGLILFSFKDANFLQSAVALSILSTLYDSSVKAFSTRLHSHTALKSTSGDLLFPYRVLYAFPDTLTEELSSDVKDNRFLKQSCLFKEQLNQMRSSHDSDALFIQLLQYPNEGPQETEFRIDESLRDVIINRIAPWATIPKITQAEIERSIKLAKSKASLDNIELMHSDSLIDVLRLDKRQVDEVNAIKKGHQLILACAGSGKSVILIAKCFKLASLDRNREFLLLCYNKNLRDYYAWQIDEAGFSERNVKCLTIHQLFNQIIIENKIPRPYEKQNTDQYYEAVAQRVSMGLKSGIIQKRYYGIFIDEVQIFKPLWYRICCMLLEDSEGSDHVLTICGDLTQNLKKNVKHGMAPWQGENLPIFRGHTIHIETNYRNSIQINDFVNIYAGLVKARLPESIRLTTDTYLRGTAFRNGSAPIISYFTELSAECEAKKIIHAIRYMHDEQNIGYSEIAVLLYNQSSSKGIGYKYPLLAKLKSQFYTDATDIPFLTLSWDQDERKPYALRDGVSVITYEGALGIDFRGIIVAGITLIGTREGIAYDDADSIENKPGLIDDYRIGYDALYLACTRAKDSLAIMLPAHNMGFNTSYTNIIHDCIAAYKSEKGKVIEL